MNKETILIVVDMQNDFVNGSLGTKEAINIVPNVVNRIRDFKGKIFVTMDTHYKDSYLNHTLEGYLLPVEHCIEDAEGWQLNVDVKNALEENKEINNYEIIKKNTFGSVELPKKIIDYVFSLPDFDATKDPVEVEIIGLCTDICVISNALLLRANFPNIHIRTYIDCCAGTTVENHNSALAVMKSCQIEIV